AATALPYTTLFRSQRELRDERRQRGGYGRDGGREEDGASENRQERDGGVCDPVRPDRKVDRERLGKDAQRHECEDPDQGGRFGPSDGRPWLDQQYYDCGQVYDRDVRIGPSRHIKETSGPPTCG